MLLRSESRFAPVSVEMKPLKPIVSYMNDLYTPSQSRQTAVDSLHVVVFAPTTTPDVLACGQYSVMFQREPCRIMHHCTICTKTLPTSNCTFCSMVSGLSAWQTCQTQMATNSSKQGRIVHKHKASITGWVMEQISHTLPMSNTQPGFTTYNFQNMVNSGHVSSSLI